MKRPLTPAEVRRLFTTGTAQPPARKVRKVRKVGPREAEARRVREEAATQNYQRPI